MAEINYGKDILDINSYIYFIHHTRKKIEQKWYWVEAIESVVRRTTLHLPAHPLREAG